MLDFLNFNSRLTKLSDEEKQDFTYCNEGYPRTEEMQASYDNADEERREYLLDMWARSTYMRLCMWRGYLSGNTDKKPTILTLANAA